MPIATIDDVLYTTTEAAQYLGFSENTVRVYIARGIIEPEKIGPLNFVRRSECDRYKREKNPRGNPNFLRKTRKKRRS